MFNLRVNRKKRLDKSSIDVDELRNILAKRSWVLAFPELVEQKYQSHMEEVFIKENMRFVAVGLLVYASFSFFDYFVYSDYYQWVMPFRFVTIAIIILLIWLNAKKQLFPNTLGLFTMGLCLCVFQINVSSFFMETPYDMLFCSGTITLSVFALAMLRYSVKHTLVYFSVCVLLFFSALISAFTHLDTGHEIQELITLIAPAVLFILITIGAFGLFSIYSIESLNRQNWLQMRIMAHEANEYKALSGELKFLSETDGLTKLKNRRYFDKQLRQVWKKCAEKSEPLSFIMMDVDWFKPYNDNYGHPAGDDCLQQLAKAISSHPVLDERLVCRYGGEEFCVVLPEYDAQQAKTVAEIIRSNVEKLAIKHEYSHYGVCTVSIGLHTMQPCNIHNETKLTLALAGFVKNADDALYHAKTLGKNRVVLASDVISTFNVSQTQTLPSMSVVSYNSNTVEQDISL